MMENQYREKLTMNQKGDIFINCPAAPTSIHANRGVKR
jgi:hypothetical protein